MEKSINLVARLFKWHPSTVEKWAVRLQSLIGNRRVVPPLPSGSTIEVLADEPQNEATDFGAVIQIPQALFIAYRDSAGRISQRRIACRKFEPATGTVLAYCYERRALRRFVAERVDLWACPSTGEVFSTAEVIAVLQSGGDPVGDPRLSRLLLVLVFVMLCDREAHQLEKDAIERAVTSFALRFDGDDHLVGQAVKVASRMVPDVNDVIGAIRWIAQSPDALKLANLLSRWIDDVVMADERITSEEAVFAGEFKDALAAVVAVEKL